MYFLNVFHKHTATFNSSLQLSPYLKVAGHVVQDEHKSLAPTCMKAKVVSRRVSLIKQRRLFSKKKITIVTYGYGGEKSGKIKKKKISESEDCRGRYSQAHLLSAFPLISLRGISPFGSPCRSFYPPCIHAELCLISRTRLSIKRKSFYFRHAGSGGGDPGPWKSAALHQEAAGRGVEGWEKGGKEERQDMTSFFPSQREFKDSAIPPTLSSQKDPGDSGANC